MAEEDGAPAEDLPKWQLKTSEGVKTIRSFHSMDLQTDLRLGLCASVIDKPTDIQKRAIKPIANGGNVIIVQDRTGIVTLSIGVLQRLDMSLNETQVLCLHRNRDLAVRMQKVISEIGRYMNNLQCKVCIGGTDVNGNESEMQNSPHIISGTLGRVSSMIYHSEVSTNTIKMLVLNGDEFFENEFKAQVDHIREHLPSLKQVVFKTSKMNKKMFEMTSDVIKDPIIILGKRNPKKPKTKYANKYRKKSNRQSEGNSNGNPKTRLKYLKSLSKYQLKTECSNIEDRQRQLYLPKIKAIDTKVDELSKEIHNLYSQIMLPWASAEDVATSLPSSSASKGVACQLAPIDSLKEQSKINSSTSGNEVLKEQEGVVDDNGQLPEHAEIMANFYELPMMVSIEN